jgi:hypothetical protein
MKERKEEFPNAWLSYQQKKILELVCNETPLPKEAKELSWDIARKFDNEQDNRIELGTSENEILSKTHKASMSRSLKRLRERKLIEGKDGIFGKKLVGLTKEGLDWCKKLNYIVDDSKQKQKIPIVKEIREVKQIEQKEGIIDDSVRKLDKTFTETLESDVFKKLKKLAQKKG